MASGLKCKIKEMFGLVGLHIPTGEPFTISRNWLVLAVGQGQDQ